MLIINVSSKFHNKKFQKELEIVKHAYVYVILCNNLCQN